MQSIDSMSGLPVSRVMSVASSFPRWRMASPTLRSATAFSTPGSLPQATWAWRAARTARSTSSAPQSATRPTRSPVAGLRISRVAFDRAASHRPPTRIGAGVSMRFMCQPSLGGATRDDRR